MEWITIGSIVYVVFRLLFTTAREQSTFGMDEPGGDL